MMNFKNFPQLKKVIKTQCEFAGLKFEDVDFNSPEWFSEFSWTIEDEEEFKSWLMNEIYKNYNLRYELTGSRINNRKINKKVVDMFILNYGFKLKEKDEEEN